MSCIHYKFRNNSKYDTIQFDGSYITVGDIKQAILGQKKMGKAPDFVLEIINAQTQEAYRDDNQLIPRNADVTVKRIPTGTRVSKIQLAAQSTSIDNYKMSATPLPVSVTMENDISKTEGTEEEKLKAMMMQQASAYGNPMDLNRGRGRDEDIPLNYVCHRCSRAGHLINNCPTNGNVVYDRGPRPPRKMTLSLRKAEKMGPQPTAEEKTRMEETQRSTVDKVKILAQEAYTNIPTEMKCPICKQLMVDASLSGCCGQSYCDECIRDQLLDEALCPACGEDGSPSQLIPNKGLRDVINKYKKDHSDQIAKLYSDCHIQSKSRDSTPKLEVDVKTSGAATSAPSTLVPRDSAVSSAGFGQNSGSVPKSHPTSLPEALHEATAPSSIALPPPVAILDPVEPPPPVAILPLKEEKMEVTEVTPVVSEVKVKQEITLPQLPVYASLQPAFPLPPAPPVMPFVPGVMPVLGPLPMPGPFMGQGPHVGLLPPPPPVMEESRNSDDRILDASEFYSIQRELRRLQGVGKRRSRSSSHSPRRHRHSPPPAASTERRRAHAAVPRRAEKRRQESPHRIRIERTTRYSDRRGRGGDRKASSRAAPKEPIRAVLERKIRNDRHVKDKRSRDSDERRSDLSDRRSVDSSEVAVSADVSVPASREESPARPESSEVDLKAEKQKRKKDKDHKKKKHKKKDKKEKKKRKEKELSKPSLTEYTASEDSSEEEFTRRKSPSPSPFILSPRKASPSPDRLPSPVFQPSPKRLPSPARLPTPTPSTPPSRQSSVSPDPSLRISSTRSQAESSPSTPTAKGGETPQFNNGLSSANDDAVSITMDNLDREDVNGVQSDDSSSSSDSEQSEKSVGTNLEDLRKQYQEAEAQIAQMKEQRLAEKKKLKDKKRKKKEKKEKKEKKKHKKHKKKKQKEELEEGEIKDKKSKKRKRSHSDRGSQESLTDVKKKSKKSKKKHGEGMEIKVNFTPSKETRAPSYKVNFTPMKELEERSSAISLTSPKKSESRRVHLGVSPIKPVQVKEKRGLRNEENGEAVEKPKKSKSHKKSRHKIPKNAVSGIEDDPEC